MIAATFSIVSGITKEGFSLEKLVKAVKADVDSSWKRSLVRKKGIKGWSATIASIRSKTTILTTPGDLTERTVVKLLRASRAVSACFLKDDSEGMIDMLTGNSDMKIKSKTRTFITKGVIQIRKEKNEPSKDKDGETLSSCLSRDPKLKQIDGINDDYKKGKLYDEKGNT